jgi:predicted transcriptional regulator
VGLPHEGLNQLIVRSVDPFDGSHEKWLSVTRDTIAPGIWFDTLDVDTVNHVNNPHLVVVGGTDDPKATIVVNGYQVGLLGDGAFATTVALFEGQQVMRATASDGAGNTEQVEIQITLDTVDPQLTLVSPGANPFWSNRADLDVVVSTDEPLSEITLDGDALEMVSDQVRVPIDLVDGRTELEFRATDLAGNEVELMVVLRLDTEAPGMQVLHPANGTIVNTTAIQLIIVADEPGCTVSAGDLTIKMVERDPWKLVGTVYLPRGEGIRTIRLTLTDRAGNTDTETLTVDVDTIRPGVSLVGISEGMKITTEPLLVRGSTEPDAKVVWINDEMASLSPDGEFEITIRLEEGWQNLTVRVIDRAGNYMEKSYRVKVLASPEFEVPVTALAAGTITFAMAAMVVSTEVGRYSLLVLFLPLYTKLRKEKILDQRTRGLIQGYILANPGCNYTIIRDNLDLADGTLTYHLQVLEREGYIYSIREGLFRCFYPHGLPPPKRGKLHLSDTQADIVRIVKRIPGITVGEIATAMNRRPNVISYHLKLLKDGGLLRVEEDGRHVRVYPIEPAVAMI